MKCLREPINHPVTNEEVRFGSSDSSRPVHKTRHNFSDTTLSGELEDDLSLKEKTTVVIGSRRRTLSPVWKVNGLACEPRSVEKGDFVVQVQELETKRVVGHLQ